MQSGESARPLVEHVYRRYVSEAGFMLPEVRDFLSFDDVALRFIPEAVVTWDERQSAAARALRAAEAALPPNAHGMKRANLRYGRPSELDLARPSERTTGAARG